METPVVALLIVLLGVILHIEYVLGRQSQKLKDLCKWKERHNDRVQSRAAQTTTKDHH